MINIGLANTVGDLIEAEKDVQEKNNSNFESCNAYSFFNSLDKNMVISDGLIYCKNVLLKKEPKVPLWCFILACHLEKQLKPELFEKFMEIASHDKTGRVARIEKMRMPQIAEDDVFPETRRPRLWQLQE